MNEELPPTEQSANPPLSAHDKAEGESEAGHAVFQKICDRLTPKQLREIAAHRVLNGSRRVTRDLMEKAMNAANIPEEERSALWDEYFGGAATTISEHLRRRMILIGGIREYAERVDLSVPTLSEILRLRTVTADTLAKLLGKGEQFPWNTTELNVVWQRDREAFRMRAYEMNVLGARVETLFEKYPNASRSEWVERGNAPAALKDMSKNGIRILLSRLRKGEPVDWESADRVLVGMGCTLLERVEVAEAWLEAKANPPRQRATRRVPPQESARAESEGDRETRTKPGEDTEPVQQNATPYDSALSGRPDLEIIASLVASLKEQTNDDMNSGQLCARVTEELEHERTRQSTAEQQEKVAENLEDMLFPEPLEEELEEGETEERPNFQGVHSVWKLGEYLRNFSGSGYAGYSTASDQQRIIAEEVASRAPLGINDSVSALKMLAYCYGRDPTNPCTTSLMEILSQSLGNPEQAEGTKKLMTQLVSESRFRTVLIYYRDTHPESAVTTFLGSLIDLSTLEIPQEFNPTDVTDRDDDYDELINPKPKPEAPPEKRRGKWGGGEW